jgi:hypothetical protein
MKRPNAAIRRGPHRADVQPHEPGRAGRARAPRAPRHATARRDGLPFPIVASGHVHTRADAGCVAPRLHLRTAGGALVTQVVHRERTPIRDEKGRIAMVHELERVESESDHAKHAAAIEARAKQQADELPRQVARMAAHLDDANARINELERQLADERLAHAAELEAIREAVLASALRQIDQAEAMTAELNDPESEWSRALTLLRSAARDDLPYTLPADLIDLPGLAAWERDIRALRAADPEITNPDRVRYVLPSEAA